MYIYNMETYMFTRLKHILKAQTTFITDITC